MAGSAVDVEWFVVGLTVRWAYGTVVRSNVTSRKWTIFWFASAMIFKPRSLEIFIKSFRTLSASLPLVVFKIAKQSSLYKPILSFPNFFPSYSK